MNVRAAVGGSPGVHGRVQRIEGESFNLLGPSSIQLSFSYGTVKLLHIVYQYIRVPYACTVRVATRPLIMPTPRLWNYTYY